MIFPSGSCESSKVLATWVIRAAGHSFLLRPLVLIAWRITSRAICIAKVVTRAPLVIEAILVEALASCSIMQKVRLHLGSVQLTPVASQRKWRTVDAIGSPLVARVTELRPGNPRINWSGPGLIGANRLRRPHRILRPFARQGHLFGIVTGTLALRGMQRRSRILTELIHSITSSARASSVGGTVRPIVLAVCRLTTNSNFTARRTGRSLGFSPLRTRPV